MSVFVDTPAVFAVLDRDDAKHTAAGEAWRDLVEAKEHLVTSNYVLGEATALVQARLGPKATAAFVHDLVPLLTVEWIGPEVHEAAISALLVAGRSLSLVDCASFDLMRRLGLHRAFTFDRHFARQGFEVVP
jgi:uncharacterized protein